MKIALLVLAAVLPVKAQLLTMDELVNDWKVSKQFTLEVAEKMPAEFYDFKPSPEQMTFGRQMLHISGTNVFRFEQLTGIASKIGPPEKADKATAILKLTESFDYVIRVLPKITPEQLTKMYKVDWRGRPEVAGREMMLGMFVHTAHHRAQCEVYLRLKGIQPPDYMF
jgi:uncharacterized damage-inducible protein DinB